MRRALLLAEARHVPAATFRLLAEAERPPRAEAGTYAYVVQAEQFPFMKVGLTMAAVSASTGLFMATICEIENGRRMHRTGSVAILERALEGQ